MVNPYQAPVHLDESFDPSSRIAAARGFSIVGLVCGMISGVAFLVFPPATAAALTLLIPGLVLGIGVAFATWRWVPHARRKRAIALPFMAIFATGVLGLGLDQLQIYPDGTWSSFFVISAKLAGMAAPGALILGLSCLMLATPRSYVRFVLFMLVAMVLVGIAAAVVRSPIRSPIPLPLIAISIVEFTFLSILGWIFSDSQPKGYQAR